MVTFSVQNRQKRESNRIGTKKTQNAKLFDQAVRKFFLHFVFFKNSLKKKNINLIKPKPVYVQTSRDEEERRKEQISTGIFFKENIHNFKNILNSFLSDKN